jgi:hypothetical protein
VLCYLPIKEMTADISYVPFDFHAKCHGMKWEIISELVQELDFAKMGYFWSLSNEPLREQTGVFRTKYVVLTLCSYSVELDREETDSKLHRLP